MRLLPLSARSDQALRELAGRYLSWLDEQTAQLPDSGELADLGALQNSETALEEFLADMAWTASVGRNHFECRAAVLFSGFEDLRAGLRAVADDDRQQTTATASSDPNPAESPTAESPTAESPTAESPTAESPTAESPTAEAVAVSYEAGLDVPFLELFQGETRHRIPLPGYPFQRRRYWVEPRPAIRSSVAPSRGDHC